MKMKINQITQQSSQQKNGVGSSSPKAFGMHFNLPRQVVDEAMDSSVYARTPESIKFLAKLIEDIFQHNKTEANHFKYDEVRDITEIKIWDGYSQVLVKNNDEKPCYNFSFDYKPVEGDKYVRMGRSTKIVDDFAADMQDHLIPDKYSANNNNRLSNFRDLIARLPEALKK
jgi:hypothetical protein